MSTIKDVAKLAGVSTSTVSRTLSNRVFVEEETRQKVLKAVKELNYRPSIMAKALREGRSYTLALSVPDINSLFYPMLMKSVEKYAAEHGYFLLLCNNNEDVEQEKRNVEMLSMRGVDGILCMSVKDDVSHLVQLSEERKLPVVLVNRDLTEHLSCITINHRQGGYLMMKYLLDMGHRQIAALFSDFENQRCRERFFGCKQAMEEYGISNYKKFFVYDVMSIEEAHNCTLELLNRPERPTAFFASMDVLALGIYQGIAELGLTIPRDISVVGFDNIFVTEHMIPPVTTFSASIDELAKQSVECLIDQIENGGAPRRMVIGGSLVQRASVQRLETEKQ